MAGPVPDPYDWATDCPDDFTAPSLPAGSSSLVYALDAEMRARFENRAA